jgi:hypothetical protein
MGEANVRAFLKSPSSPTDVLSDELMLGLSQRAGPAVRNRLTSVGQSGSLSTPKAPSLAVSPALPPALLAGRGGSGGVPPRKNRPKPPKPLNEPADYWQNLIWADKGFASEQRTRQDVYDSFANDLVGLERTRFSKDPNVAVDAETWQGRYQMALAIQAGAAAQFSLNDDMYNLPTPDDMYKLPPTQPLDRSNWLVGNLVHAAWQMDYMASRQQHEILGEFRIYPGHDFEKLAKGGFMDYRTLDPDEEAPTLTGPVRYAFGRYRPDIIDFTQSWILEIKPIRSAARGILQLWRYTHNYNCARYFDELTKAGAAGMPRYFLSPGALSDIPFNPFEVTGYVDKYFEQYPDAARSPINSDLKRLRASGKEIWAIPIIVRPIPGLVLYMIHDKKRPSQAEQQQLTDIIKTGLIVVATVAIIAAILVAAIAAAAPAEAIVAGLIGGETTQLTAGAVEVGLLGEQALVVEQMPAAVSAFDSTLTSLSPVLDPTGL